MVSFINNKRLLLSSRAKVVERSFGLMNNVAAGVNEHEESGNALRMNMVLNTPGIDNRYSVTSTWFEANSILICFTTESIS
jgi:hypothetical protein